MAGHLILYSANTWLAYVIAERYYQGEHHVWCTPHFSSSSQARIDAATPPTSTPSDIYHSLDREVDAGDLHSPKIEQNRVGLLKGADIKFQQGVINAAQKQDIATVVERAQIRDFKPYIYVIPMTAVSNLLQDVPVLKRAHPMSVEYIIERLPRPAFDVIELNGR